MTEAQRHAATFFYSHFPRRIKLVTGTIEPLSEVMVKYADRYYKHEMQALYDEACARRSEGELTVEELLKAIESQLKKK